MTRDQGKFALDELRNIPLQRHADESLLPQAFTLANDIRRSFYDSLYAGSGDRRQGGVEKEESPPLS